MLLYILIKKFLGFGTIKVKSNKLGIISSYIFFILSKRLSSLTKLKLR